MIKKIANEYTGNLIDIILFLQNNYKIGSNTTVVWTVSNGYIVCITYSATNIHWDSKYQKYNNKKFEQWPS